MDEFSHFIFVKNATRLLPVGMDVTNGEFSEPCTRYLYQFRTSDRFT
jgi:hypothetical protein